MGNAVKVLDKPEASALGEMVNAELSNQIATAKRYPRDEDAALSMLHKLATRTDGSAELCMYSLKRKAAGGGYSFITGPSVRFAELLAYSWGNIRAGARIIEEGPKSVVAQGVAYDLQRNTGLMLEVKRGIVTSSGARFGQDMINVTSNAACSIALRNAIFDCIPQILWSDVFEAVKAKAIGAAQIPERIQKAVAFFVAKGAQHEDIMKAMGVKAVGDMGREHLEIFIGLQTAMKEGAVTADKIFTEEGAEQRARLSLTDDDGDQGDDGSGDQFNTIDKQVQGKGATAGAKKAGGAPKDAAAKGDAGGESQKTATDPAPAGSATAAGDPETAGSRTQVLGDGAKVSGEPGDAQAQTATAGAGESSPADETDEQLVARIEAEVKAARYVDGDNGKRAIIKGAKGALERIRQTGEDEAVANRASALLKKFDLSK